MSTVAIYCPTCGSTVTDEIKPDNYRCQSCQASFNFVRTYDKVVTQDVRTHNCPICGKNIPPGSGNLCKNCNTGDLCRNCAQELPKRGLVCKQCIMQEKKDCFRCGYYSNIVCACCYKCKINGKEKNFVRSCNEHLKDYFWYPMGVDKFDTHYYSQFECESCAGPVCSNCVIRKKSFWNIKYLCTFCNSKLREVEHFTITS